MTTEEVMELRRLADGVPPMSATRSELDTLDIKLRAGIAALLRERESLIAERDQRLAQQAKIAEKHADCGRSVPMISLMYACDHCGDTWEVEG